MSVGTDNRYAMLENGLNKEGLLRPAMSPDEEEKAEYAVADIIGYRANPHRGSYLAVSMLRSQYKEDALVIVRLSNGEKTRLQLETLSLSELPATIEFLAFCSGYMAARMFMPRVGDGAVLSRLLLADNEPIPEAIRKESIERSNLYIPALSEIHDNRSSPRDSRLVHSLLSSYLAVLIEDPRQTTLETLLGGYEGNDIHHATTAFSARQIAQALDASRLWATLGWRRGLAERRFRMGPRAKYLENIAGDVRIIFNRNHRNASFSDIRRLRMIDLETVRTRPHPCDDLSIATWIADNCALAQLLWSKPA